MRELVQGVGAYLLFDVESFVCALPLADVIETMRPMPLRPLEGAPPFVLGVAVVRGEPTPVVDAGALVGAGVDGTQSAPGRFVAVKTGERRVCLAVSRVRGVQRIDAASVGELPPLLRQAGRDVVTAIGTMDAALLLVLEGARALPPSVWATVDASHAEDGFDGRIAGDWQNGHSKHAS